jgi:hypothetical protein
VRLPKDFPAAHANTMRAELQQLVTTWTDRDWSKEAMSVTLIGLGLHLAKSGGWWSIDHIVTTIRTAWPFLKVSSSSPP